LTVAGGIKLGTGSEGEERKRKGSERKGSALDIGHCRVPAKKLVC